jgi:hypothetical protein
MPDVHCCIDYVDTGGEVTSFMRWPLMKARSPRTVARRLKQTTRNGRGVQRLRVQRKKPAGCPLPFGVVSVYRYMSGSQVCRWAPSVGGQGWSAAKPRMATRQEYLTRNTRQVTFRDARRGFPLVQPRPPKARHFAIHSRAIVAARRRANSHDTCHRNRLRFGFHASTRSHTLGDDVHRESCRDCHSDGRFQ